MCNFGSARSALHSSFSFPQKKRCEDDDDIDFFDFDNDEESKEGGNEDDSEKENKGVFEAPPPQKTTRSLLGTSLTPKHPPDTTNEMDDMDFFENITSQVIHIFMGLII